MSSSLSRSLRALRIAAPTPSAFAARVIPAPGSSSRGIIMRARFASGVSSGPGAAPVDGDAGVSENTGSGTTVGSTPAPEGESGGTATAKSSTETTPETTQPTESTEPEPASASSSSISQTSSSSSPSPSASASVPSFIPILPYSQIPRPQSLSSTHHHINFPNRIFGPPPSSARPETLGGREDDKRDKIQSAASGLSQGDIRGLKRFTVRLGRVTQMTKKGKMPSFTALVVVGSPTRGLVGIGWGRGLTAGKATDSGFNKAVQSMDYVNRYENRTVWGEGKDLEYKWGAVKVLIRARPAGFGLMVPPALHRVFTACGIRDVSATIEGSRNPVEVVKCAIQILHGGANPPGFGSGLNGSRGRREDKGRGMRSRDEIERERGRKGVDVGLRA